MAGRPIPNSLKKQMQKATASQLERVALFDVTLSVV